MTAGLTDKQVQAKLDQITKLSRELVAEGERRYGARIDLFACDSSLYLMSGDNNANADERRQFIKFTADGYCAISGGGW